MYGKRYLKWSIYLILLLEIAVFKPAKGEDYLSGISETDFLGHYYYTVPGPTETNPNPWVMILNVDGDGFFYRCDKLLYGTTGTTTYKYYYDYELTGNVLVCYYDRKLLEAGMRPVDMTPGSDTFIISSEGNLLEGLDIWYKQPEKVDSNELISVRNTDFPMGNYSPNATFLGIKDLKRKDIETVSFTTIPDNAPEDAWDVSAAQDKSILAWRKDGKSKKDIVIGSWGGVFASDPKDLFRCCENLRIVDFNTSFFIFQATSVDYMFDGCKKLEEIVGLSSLGFGNVGSAKRMFADCRSIKSIDLGGFAETYLFNTQEMFLNCSSLKTLDVSGLDISVNNHDDIYKGTRWEGESPMMDMDVQVDPVKRLLSYDEIHVYFGPLQIESIRVNKRICSEYDRILGEKYEAFESELLAFGEKMGSFSGIFDILLDTSEDYLFSILDNTNLLLMYGFAELTRDNIPEMVIMECNQWGGYSYSIYGFDLEAWKGKELAIGTCADYRVYEDSGRFIYYDMEDQLKQISFRNDEAIKEEEPVESTSRLKIIDFNASLGYDIDRIDYDADGDGTINKVKVIKVEGTDKLYRFFMISVDGFSAYSLASEKHFSEVTAYVEDSDEQRLCLEVKDKSGQIILSQKLKYEHDWYGRRYTVDDATEH